MLRPLLAALVLAASAGGAWAQQASSQPADASPSAAVHPTWAATPSGDDLAKAYPSQALSRGVEGRARIRCAVEPDGRLSDCVVIAEEPAGMGFGRATLSISGRFRMTPYQAEPGAARPQVVIPIRWAIASDQPAAPAVRSDGPAAPPWVIAAAMAGFVVIWLAVGSLLGLLSGWYGLMRRYPDRRETPIIRFGSQSGSMGAIGVNLSGILRLAACPSGLRVSMWRMFGPFSRSFLVPWREIRAEPYTAFFTPMVRLDFGNPGSGELRIQAWTWERLAAAARGRAAAGVPPALPRVSEGRRVRGFLIQWAMGTAAASAALYFRQRGSGFHWPVAACVAIPAVLLGVVLYVRYLAQRPRP